MKTSEQSRRNLIALTVHLVWTTWKRQPYLVGERERVAYRCLSAEAEKLGVPILALNGMPDHVHLLVLLPSSVSLAKLMHQLKGARSHLLNSEFPDDEHCRWANGYAAFSWSHNHRDNAIAYIENQKQHHAAGEVRVPWERTPEESAQ